MNETTSTVLMVAALLFGPIIYAAFKFITMVFGSYFICEIISDYFNWKTIEVKYFLMFFATSFVLKGLYNLAK